jgi:hypothetical protein
MRCPACWKDIEIPMVGVSLSARRGAEARRGTGTARRTGTGRRDRRGSSSRVRGTRPGRARGTRRFERKRGGRVRGRGGREEDEGKPARWEKEEKNVVSAIALTVLIAIIGLEILVGVGMLASGGGSRTRAMMTCPSCHGVRYEQCSLCGGGERARCRECDGQGTRINSFNQSEKCAFCTGIGTVPCPTCGGRGQYACSRCDGEGKVRK